MSFVQLSNSGVNLIWCSYFYTLDGATCYYFLSTFFIFDGVDHLIDILRTVSFAVLLRSTFEFLSLRLLSRRLAFVEAPGAGILSRLIRFPGSQRDIGKHPFLLEKEDLRGFEPPTLGVAIFYADR